MELQAVVIYMPARLFSLSVGMVCGPYHEEIGHDCRGELITHGGTIKAIDLDEERNRLAVTIEGTDKKMRIMFFYNPQFFCEQEINPLAPTD